MATRGDVGRPRSRRPGSDRRHARPPALPVRRSFRAADRKSEEALHARRLLKPEERAALEDVHATVAAAVAAWRSDAHERSRSRRCSRAGMLPPRSAVLVARRSIVSPPRSRAASIVFAAHRLPGSARRTGRLSSSSSRPGRPQTFHQGSSTSTCEAARPCSQAVVEGV